jgi:hypothetical protein
VRFPIFHLAVTGLFAWSFAVSSVCEARCAQSPTGLPGASQDAGGPAPADPAGGCEHGSQPGDASDSSGGALVCCCAAAAVGAPLQIDVQAARDAGAFRPLALASHPGLARSAPYRGPSLPPGTAPMPSIHLQHRNPPLLI